MTSKLCSPLLQFSRDGRNLIAADPRSVSITDVRGGGTRSIDAADVIAAVAFADQIWIARGSVLARHALDGRLLDESALPAGPATLVAAPVGAAAALWTATPVVAWIEDGTKLQRWAPASSGDLAMPLTGRRWVTAQGARISAPSGLSCELSAGTRVVAGAVVIDGTALAILTDSPTGRELAMIGLTNGRLLWRKPLPVVEVRVAHRRGVAVAMIEPRRFAVIDLRSGRLLGYGASELELADLAIDPDGQRIAMRAESGRIELATVAEALAATVASVVVAEQVEPVAETTPSEEPEQASSQVAHHAPLVIDVRPVLHRPFDLRALSPIVHADPISRADALALLDREMRSVSLWTLRAIAEAWDTRRLGYGNEGKHPYEHEVAALLGMNRGFAADYLEAARDHLVTHVANPTDRGAATPIGALAGELGLSPLAIDILLAVAAPALQSEVARLYGILANDPGRALVDEALVEQVLGPRVNRHDLAAELDPRAPLLRLGAIRVESRARPFAGLSIDPIVLARLRREEPDFGAALAVRGADRALEDLAIGAEVIPGALDALARSPVPARIALHGRPGSGRRTLLAALASEAGRPLGIVDAALLPRVDTAFSEALRLVLRRAQLAGLLPCVVGLDAVAFADRKGCDVAAEVLRAHPGPVAVVLPVGEVSPFPAGHIAIELPVLAEGERVAVWKAALANVGLEVRDPDALAARYRIGPGVIHRAISAVTERGVTGDATIAIEHFIRQTRDARLSAYARRVERLASWETLVLASDVLDSLRELVSRVRHRRTVFETWGMGHAMSTARGLTALFQGQPGTGKTLVAGVIARELGLDLYQVDLSKVMSKWLGETERNLGAIFDAAEDGQVILLFDEADSLFARRTEVRSSNDRYANLEVNYLLQRLDCFEGIAILTTNSGGTIDPAFKRRMSFGLSFPFPDEDTREQLWRVHLPPQLPISGPLALDKLAHKYQLSGGYIRNACLRAAFLAAQDEGPLDQTHLERAVALEFAELGKLSNAGAIG